MYCALSGGTHNVCVASQCNHGSPALLIFPPRLSLPVHGWSSATLPTGWLWRLAWWLSPFPSSWNSESSSPFANGNQSILYFWNNFHIVIRSLVVAFLQNVSRACGSDIIISFVLPTMLNRSALYYYYYVDENNPSAIQRPSIAINKKLQTDDGQYIVSFW